MTDEQLKEIEKMMFSSFQLLSKPQQIRTIMLGGNAEFIIRMLGTPDQTNEVGKAAASILEALTRCIRSSDSGEASR